MVWHGESLFPGGVTFARSRLIYAKIVLLGRVVLLYERQVSIGLWCMLLWTEALRRAAQAGL